MFALIERAASRAPGSPAVVGDAGSVTYGELEAEARRIASGLRRTGRSRVGVVEPDAARCVALLAASSLTGVEVCLYPPDIGPGELASTADRLDHDLVITDREDLAWPSVGYADLRDDDSIGGSAPPARQPVLILTSGTTAVSRGVRHDWSRLIARSLRSSPEPAQRWLLAFGVHQFAGFQIMIHVAAIGATMVDPGVRRPREGLAAMRAHGVTHASATPTFWRFLLAEIRADGGSVPALEQVTLGGEPVPSAALRDLEAAFGTARISQIYAASEFGPTGTVGDRRNGLPLSVLDRGEDADVAIKIVDGELWVRSRVGMLGYHGETPLVDPDGWRPSGDLVEVDNGRIVFCGRATETINVGGVKVHPLPIEERISAVRGVTMTRVYGRRSPVTGSIVAAEIVLADGADPEQTRSAVVEACADLPPVSRLRSITFVDALATNGHKIVRRTDDD